MYIKILFLYMTVVSARNLNSVTDTDNSDVYNKQAKLDFETTTTNEIIIPPHSHDSHENSHEVANGPYDVKGKSDNPVSSFNLTSDKFHDHFNVSAHKLPELNHSFPNHELGPGYEADDTYFTNKDVKGFDKRIDDIFKDTTNTGNPSFGMGPLETELENSQKDQSNRGFLGSNFGFSSIGSPKFEFELQSPHTISESQNTFDKKMSERLYKRDLERFNIQNRDEQTREQHNLRSLHQQRMNQNQYLESLIADNRKKFESEAENRGTFTNSKQTRNTNQNIGYESQYEGSRQQFQSNFDKETTNHFERRDTEEENNRKEPIDRRKQSNSDHRRRHQSQMDDSNTKPDLENSKNIGRNKEHQIHRPMQNSNKRNDDFDVNSSRHKHGNKNRDEKHSVQQKFENAGYNNSNKNTPESNYTMLVASNNRNTNDSRSVKESPQNGVREIETNNEDDFNIQNTNARNDQRPVMITTTVKEDLKPKENSDDGEKDRWVWSGEKMNAMNNTHNEELKGKTTTLGPDLDDRAAFNGDKCPTGKAKIGNTCVNLD